MKETIKSIVEGVYSELEDYVAGLRANAFTVRYVLDEMLDEAFGRNGLKIKCKNYEALPTQLSEDIYMVRDYFVVQDVKDSVYYGVSLVYDLKVDNVFVVKEMYLSYINVQPISISDNYDFTICIVCCCKECLK